MSSFYDITLDDYMFKAGFICFTTKVIYQVNFTWHILRQTNS